MASLTSLSYVSSSSSSRGSSDAVMTDAPLQAAPILLLSEELQLLILSHSVLDLCDVGKAALTCRQWHRLTLDVRVGKKFLKAKGIVRRINENWRETYFKWKIGTNYCIAVDVSSSMRKNNGSDKTYQEIAVEHTEAIAKRLLPVAYRGIQICPFAERFSTFHIKKEKDLQDVLPSIQSTFGNGTLAKLVVENLVTGHLNQNGTDGQRPTATEVYLISDFDVHAESIIAELVKAKSAVDKPIFTLRLLLVGAYAESLKKIEEIRSCEGEASTGLKRALQVLSEVAPTGDAKRTKIDDPSDGPAQQ